MTYDTCAVSVSKASDSLEETHYFRVACNTRKPMIHAALLRLQNVSEEDGALPADIHMRLNMFVDGSTGFWCLRDFCQHLSPRRLETGHASGRPWGLLQILQEPLKAEETEDAEQALDALPLNRLRGISRQNTMFAGN